MILRVDLAVVIDTQIWSGLCFPPGQEQIFTGVNTLKVGLTFKSIFQWYGDCLMIDAMCLRDALVSTMHAVNVHATTAAPVRRLEPTTGWGTDFVYVNQRRLLAIEDVDAFRAEMDRKADHFRDMVSDFKDKYAGRFFLSDYHASSLNRCGTFYHFEQLE